MKLRPYYYSFLVLCCALMCSISVSAQEGRGQDVEPVVKESSPNEPDPILSSESESRSLKATPPVISSKEAVRDSVQVKITKPTTSKSAEKDQKGEDPLSFNFLYYIIEKFKLSDIIE